MLSRRFFDTNVGPNALADTRYTAEAAFATKRIAVSECATIVTGVPIQTAIVPILSLTPIKADG